MPSPPHEIAVATISADPTLLSALAERLLGKRLPRLPPLDSTVRLANPDEIRPDLLLARPKKPWVALEVQDDDDQDKARRWPLLVSVLHSQRRCMGDLIVLTCKRHVARWALRVCDATGPLGTTLRLKPTVLLLRGDTIASLLDQTHPELAFFAAWAMQHRHGRSAANVVRKALDLTDTLPEPLRRARVQSILGVLGPRLARSLKETIMDMHRTPQTPWMREMRAMKLELVAKGKAQGKRDALLTFLETRGFKLSPEVRRQIRSCSDLALLDHWISCAATATTIEQALAPPSGSAHRSPRTHVRTKRAAKSL
jgi:hypothetical protein